jgi:activator of Hsp90 ATPase-like protein
MTAQSYSTKFVVDGTPEQAFVTITSVRDWWPDIEGNAEKIGDTFKHSFEDMHRCELVVKEMIPGQKIVWTVVDNYFGFTKDKTEWKGTDIVFEIARKGKKTEVKFTHVGLTPKYECYDLCSDAWSELLNDTLRDLIAAGSTSAHR